MKQVIDFKESLKDSPSFRFVQDTHELHNFWPSLKIFFSFRKSLDEVHSDLEVLEIKLTQVKLTKLFPSISTEEKIDYRLLEA